MAPARLFFVYSWWFVAQYQRGKMHYGLWFVDGKRICFALICKKGKDVRNSTGDFGALRKEKGGRSNC